MSRTVNPLTFNLCTTCRWVDSFATRKLFYRRLSRPQSRTVSSGKEKHLFSLLRFELQTIQPEVVFSTNSLHETPEIDPAATNFVDCFSSGRVQEMQVVVEIKHWLLPTNHNWQTAFPYSVVTLFASSDICPLATTIRFRVDKLEVPTICHTTYWHLIFLENLKKITEKRCFVTKFFEL